MLDEHEKLVSVIKEVDVVISAVAYPQILDQLKILEAIKAAGNIKVFCVCARARVETQMMIEYDLVLATNYNPPKNPYTNHR